MNKEELQSLLDGVEQLTNEENVSAYPVDLSTTIFQPEDGSFALKVSTGEFGITLQPLFEGKEEGEGITIQPSVIPALQKILPVFGAQQKRINDSM